MVYVHCGSNNIVTFTCSVDASPSVTLGLLLYSLIFIGVCFTCLQYFFYHMIKIIFKTEGNGQHTILPANKLAV